jgi:two-component system, response regulator
VNRVILLVEDNHYDELLALRAFKRANLLNPVVVARDGEEALDFLFARGAHTAREALPALTLLDLNLPKVTGFEVLRRIRADERTRRLPVVVLTSSDEDKDKLDSYDLGANAYVRKPVEFDRFIEAAKTLGLFWLMLNEPPPDVSGQ